MSRIELGSAPEVGLRLLSVVLSIVGLDLSARAYPCGKPLRDEGHRQLLGRFRALLPPGAAWRTEVPLPLQGDQRGWDAQTGLYGLQVGVEAETRPSDLQALERRVLLKARDANIDRVIVVLADSARNRRLVRVIGEDLRAGFPIQGKSALAAIASAVDPGCNLLVLALPGVGRDRSMRASTASEAPPVRA